MKEKRRWDEQVFSGFRIVGWILLTITIIGALLWGAGVAFTVFPGSKAVGWVVLLTAFAIVALTVQRWAKILPGLLLIATLNALLTIKSGTLVNNPNVHIPWQVALLAAILLVASTVLSMQYYNRRLAIVDRIVLMSFVACIVWGMLSDFVLLL